MELNRTADSRLLIPFRHRRFAPSQPQAAMLSAVARSRAPASSFSRPPLRRMLCRPVASSLQPPDVAALSETARIRLSPQEMEAFGPKIRQVVDWFGQLQGVNLESYEPALRADTQDSASSREDSPEMFENREAMLAATPNYEDSYIKVPKVLNMD